MTNQPDDSLYRFKKQFGTQTAFQFYIGKKVWLQDIYSQLCEEENVKKDVAFFPAYRSKTIQAYKQGQI